jgi:hypothetical protein
MTNEYVNLINKNIDQKIIIPATDVAGLAIVKFDSMYYLYWNAGDRHIQYNNGDGVIAIWAKDGQELIKDLQFVKNYIMVARDINLKKTIQKSSFLNAKSALIAEWQKQKHEYHVSAAPVKLQTAAQRKQGCSIDEAANLAATLFKKKSADLALAQKCEASERKALSLKEAILKEVADGKLNAISALGIVSQGLKHK